MSKKLKVLITGITGMLGLDVANTFLNNNSYKVCGIARNKEKDYLFDKNLKVKYFDLTNLNETKKVIQNIRPDIIVHCAANVNLKKCEDNKDMAFKVNSEVPGEIASYSPNKTKFIYISSDSLFDGETGDYSEFDETNPLNIYAKSKLQGEKEVLNKNSNSIIIRTNIIGYHIPWGNSLFEWGLKMLINEKSINGFRDVIFNPIYTKQLANVIKILIEDFSYKGIINIGSDNYINKYDFLLKLAKQYGIDNTLVNKSTIDILNSSLKRPKNTTLNINKIKNLLGSNDNLDLELGLNKLKKDMFNQFIFDGGINLG